jgi:large subunit ribosomal protein L21
MVKRSWSEKMKYAILDSGGKQYIAREGETIEVDRLPLEIGKTVEFKDILLVADNGKIAVGTPTVKGASVKGRVLDQIKAAKIIVFKYVPKQRYRRKHGHRQRYTRIAIEKIAVAAPAAKKAAAKKEAPAKEESKAEAKPAAKKTTTKKTTAAKKTTSKSSTAKKKSTKSTASKKAATKSTSKKKPAAKSTKSTEKKTKSSSTKSSTKKSSTNRSWDTQRRPLFTTPFSRGFFGTSQSESDSERESLRIPRVD